MLALGEGDLDTARVDLDAMERPAHESTEPQFVGAYGWMRAELERRSGNIDPARAAVDDALDQIEYCSDDVARIAGVAAMGVRVEADAATLARDRRDEDAERVALRRAEEQLERLRLTAEAGGPVERAELAGGEAERGRARRQGRPGAVGRGRLRPGSELERPYRRAVRALAPGRGAGARRRPGGRRDGRLGGAAPARELGSDWLVAELESLAARARLRLLGPAEPAGADGAPARQSRSRSG